MPLLKQIIKTTSKESQEYLISGFLRSLSISAFFQFSTVPSTHTHLPFTESIAVNHWAFFFFLKQQLPSTTVCTYPFKALEFFLKVGIVCGNGGLF